MSVITVPPVLEDRLGTDGAQALVDLINASQIDFKVDVIEICEERFESHLVREISSVRKEISDLRMELLERMDQGHIELIEKIERNRIELFEKMERHRTELIEKMERDRGDLMEKLGRDMSGLMEKLGRDRIDFMEKLGRDRTENMKWMLLFWVGQFAVLIGILFAFFHR
ncbi:MAG: hypothetical protein AUJ92_06425 [Armatimonadetes bacterium CG2_30_59_28]|nr:hypothetical protein [Armatimonadota bacterium]OIO96238.1 MAG: hypothetical protein AUJ92_06425 [Armatimonadetes bacterium CG2_30_59_28]PIU64686.1 MAG: hypothetical protein COS85_11725 [Armatimonadetes bacterium CG07_land_8_20_14_0_80_59_28]PIX45169.1 MAG: hypothetical protein COZ56_02430 [Armatimonadetes bacterium CG_4_8_14_3_um_filter_58_9]PIY39706.1 MAG: hypothetical protein COZ05_18820 [Armatimonadetes bacterium CG_4_10_14_3_um_filter_59_10]PJB69839.1 MAG: hypothetical protein CO095_095